MVVGQPEFVRSMEPGLIPERSRSLTNQSGAAALQGDLTVGVPIFALLVLLHT